MIQAQHIGSLWSWTFTLGFVLLMLTGWAIFLKNPKPHFRHKSLFGLALLLSIIALASPIAGLADLHVFSAHMVQHILLLMLIPALLWNSLPERSTTSPVWARALYNPTLSWLAGVGFMWLLHFPILFKGTMYSSDYGLICGIAEKPYFGSIFHDLHLGLSLGVGLWFFFPLFNPWKGLQLAPLKGIIYLVSACTACSILGILITFSPADTYFTLETTSNLYYLYHEMGFSPLLDQQVGGLLMWVIGCFIYLTGCLYLFYKWINQDESQPQTIP